MAKFEPGDWLWIEDEEERYLPAKALSGFKAGTPTTVRTEDGEDHKLSAEQSAWATSCAVEILSSKIDDLINISDLSEMSILHNLRIRFREDKIYTNISSILISVNPFRLLPMYTPEILAQYRDGNPRDLPPHIFSSSHAAYKGMQSHAKDQSVIISGESGAGKSEAMKLILQFLTDVSARADQSKESKDSKSGVSSSSRLEQQILAANPILEAFGNAKTSRNNNSSRFGKLITINFDANGAINGGGIINYLLEKSRIVHQNLDERNYHIFYQLLTAASDPKMAQALKLQSPELFAITNPEGKGVVTIDNHSDEKEFEETINSMRILHFSEQDKNDTFKIVAGVLHFGNIKFVAKTEESCVIANMDVLEHAANMFGIDPAAANKALTSRLMGAHSIVVVNYNVAQAQDARDAMIKRVYADLFQIMVNKINAELSADGKSRKNFIGVLDIFGFESFEVNSFEQLCINFCNEKLQFHFNEHIFKMEQSLYVSEKIVIPGSSFVDNQPTLDLLELKGTGVFSMIDEEISVPKGSDDSLLQKMLTKHKAHPNMVAPRGKVCKDSLKCFGINHYAGTVYYNITNFLEKNKDQLHGDLIAMLAESKIPLIAGMFAKKDGEGEAAAAPGRRAGAAPKGSIKGKTLGGQFKEQLTELVNTLNATEPNFVRCMKSNDKKVGRIFNAKRMQDQLRYSGLVEVCRIRKLGYPVRREFVDFFKRFKCTSIGCADLDTLLASLTSKGVLKNGEWAKGVTRLFMRTGQSAELELHREQCLTATAVRVQKTMRRVLTWWRFKRMLATIKQVREAVASRQEEKLEEAISACGELPWSGIHLAIVKEGKALLTQLKEENRVFKLLAAAIESKDLATLKSAIAEGKRSANPAAKLKDMTAQAQALVERIESEQACKAGLKAASASRSMADLTKFIAEASKLGITNIPEFNVAVTVQKSVKDEEEALAAIANAGNEIEKLNAALGRCQELGMSQKPTVKAAADKLKKIMEERGAAEQEKQRKLEAEAAARRQNAVNELNTKLQAAMASLNLSSLNDLLAQAIQAGLTNDVVTKAQTTAKDLGALEEARAQLSATLSVLKVKAKSKLLADDFADIKAVIERAKKVAADTSIPFPDVNKAEKTLNNYQAHLAHYAVLDAAIKSNDRLVLQKAVSTAENIQMETDQLAMASEILRDLELAYREQKAAAGEELESEEPQDNYDEAEEKRQAKRDVARQLKFEIQHARPLRTLDDFSKGFLLSKNRVKEGMLLHSDDALPKSLTNLDSNKNKRALELFLNIQGYMGDKHMPYPAMLAQDVLKTGVADKDLRDEIYLQIIKQLASNTRAESVAKGWQLMCMCVGTFPPSFDMEYYLLHYIISKVEGSRGAVVDYANYCLRTLEAMLSNVDFKGGYVPDTDAILAYKDRPPILATIYLVDGGEVITDLPVTPDVNVGKIITLCGNWLSLTDPRINTLGIFVYDEGPIDASISENAPYSDLERTPRPLRNDDYMGDVIVLKARQKRNFKFVLKKKLFLPNDNARGEDEKYERLVYIQGEDDVFSTGNVTIPDIETMANLSCISMSVAWGEELGNDYETLESQQLMSFVGPAWRDQLGPEEWAEKILSYTSSCVGNSSSDLEDMFLRCIEMCPNYGVHWFHVKLLGTPGGKCRSLPKYLYYGFSHVGLTIYDLAKKPLQVFTYAEIYRWGGSSSQFSLILSDDLEKASSMELVVVSAQAQDMAAIILDHIRALLKMAK